MHPTLRIARRYDIPLELMLNASDEETQLAAVSHVAFRSLFVQDLVFAFLAAAAGMLICIVAHLLVVSLGGFSLAAPGIFSAAPLFWTSATQRLRTGSALVAGIALINAIGDFGGFVGPAWMGWLLDRTHFFSAGLLSLGNTHIRSRSYLWT